MFQFPAFAPVRLCVQRQVTGLPQPSFLIQKSRDQRLFASFSGLIAGFHVFRRLSMPRHPPYALSNLTTFIDHRQAIFNFRFAIFDLHRTPQFSTDYDSSTGRGETVAATLVISRNSDLKGSRQKRCSTALAQDDNMLVRRRSSHAGDRHRSTRVWTFANPNPISGKS
jgi:hypothetical protein